MSLFFTWLELAAAADEILRKYIVNRFERFGLTVCEMMARDALTFSRFGDGDERLYDYVSRLMDAYREAVNLIENSAEPDPVVNDLLAGICDILNSRLKEFEDAAPNDKGNPITEEKRGIIEGALLYTLRQIENQARLYPAKNETWTALRGVFLNKKEIHWQDETVLVEMYVHYQDGLRFCLLGLDDYYGRKVTRFYTEFIQREWEVLEAMIRVQAQALETALTAVQGAEVPPGSVPVHVLNILREAYQQPPILLQTAAQTVLYPSNESPQKITPPSGNENTVYVRNSRSYESFAETVKTKTGDIPQPAVIPDSTAFFVALAEETAVLFGQQRITFLKAAYRMQRMIGEEILIAEEAAALFNTAFVMLKEQQTETTETEGQIITNITETERQIITGITETLEIKIESLRESIQNFNGESASLLQSFAKEKNDVTDEIKESAYRVIREAWLNDPPDEAGVPCFFQRCQEGEAFAPYRADYEKHINHYMAKMEKAALRFKKDILLYEVNTYEEILTHSVSRLMESGNEAVRIIAVRLHDTYTALEVLLRKNNITPIRPSPRDIFNGKEHEVLVAEKQEGFNKGEIIKLVGSGYKHNDLVLLRANVIAAR